MGHSLLCLLGLFLLSTVIHGNAQDKPKAELRADNTAVPVGGSVTLTCSVNPSSSSGWKYYWYKEKYGVPVRLRDAIVLSNDQISVSEGGLYWCRGKSRRYSSEYSQFVRIHTIVPIRPVVALYPNWSEIYRGETITVRCEIHGGDTEWDYEWEANSMIKAPNQTEYRIRSASSSNSGNYRCKGRMKSSQHETTEWSDSVTLTVSTSEPRATLTAQSSVIPAGGSVTLSCSVEGSAGWKFDWFRRDSVSSKAQLMRGNEANRVISVSQGGLYHCRGGRGDPVYYTEDSSDDTVMQNIPIRTTVILQHNWPQIYSGETVTVRCEIQGGEGAQWTYEWRQNKLNTPPTSNEYRIITVTESDGGEYSCRGRTGYFLTQWSDIITLTVSYEPRPVLTVSPSWLSPGASVTLNCEVEHPSAGWSFYWYKAVPDLSEKSSSYELLPDGSGTAQDSYIIHGQTHTAGYVCRAGRGDPEYHTDHSRPKFVWSADVHSAASLTVSPDRVQHFTSDSVSLTCEGNFTEWRVRKFSEDGRLYSDCRRMTGSTCDINTSKSDTGVYWCESGSGEFSSAVNITVQNDGNGPILVSPVHPVTEGASVNLSCSLRTQKILSNVFFYHNDKLIQNDTRGELKISAVSKSDEGFYKCQYSGRESAQSWMSVKGEQDQNI
ncbi:basement membrane-specific heparan sulfate proteoglycan core protein-like [Simochromis diagramma]|uniref:basement membrane-specific heparan sulfate proteoglycan core protein-like n=1 Tax=Simochromis diagramma TaxID=43689 RepID=UPI001A7E78D9|nr:basement membrane-specific heparan sulfate proteoglycan core protein-like [Simochromis diagramma]